MITINRFEHKEFTSNTYLIRHKVFNENVYLIDIGNSKEVLDILRPNQKVKGIFLTQAHYENICGINNIIDQFPECIVYCTEYAYEALLSEKLNLSFYHLEPLVFKGDHINFIHEFCIIHYVPLIFTSVCKCIWIPFRITST